MPLGPPLLRSGHLYSIYQSRKLLGANYLTVNVECPQPEFYKQLYCVGSQAADWSGACGRVGSRFRTNLTISSALAQTAFRELNSALLELPESKEERSAEMRRLTLNYYRSLNLEHGAMCSALTAFLSCLTEEIRALCGTKPASFIHTSLASNFFKTQLPSLTAVVSLLQVCFKLSELTSFV